MITAVVVVDYYCYYYYYYYYYYCYYCRSQWPRDLRPLAC